MLPDISEPMAATQCIRYWQKVSDLQRQFCSDVHLGQRFHNNEDVGVRDWVTKTQGEKFLSIGQTSGNFTKDTSLRLWHMTTVPQYHYDRFVLPSALAYSAHRIGLRLGWGVHQTSAVPVKGNAKFSQAFANGGGLEDEEMNFHVAFELTRAPSLMIFTEERDEKAEEMEPDPVDVYDRVPLVGVGH